MTASSDANDSVQEDPSTGQPVPVPGEVQQPAKGYMERPMIPVALLTAHPGNVRADRQADRQFCQSVAGAGIITPLEITTSPDHDGYVVVDGNIRLDAAIKVGLDAVPYVFSPGTADHTGQQYLHMLISSRFRRDLNVHEEAAALFSASQAGMSRAQIRRATGLKASEVRAGITAGSLSASTRELTGNAEYEWTLEDLALLAPFEGDPGAMSRILQALDYGQPLAYITQKLTDELEQNARRGKLLVGLHERGVTVVDQPPPCAVSVSMLRAGPPPGGTQRQDSDVPRSDADGPGAGGELDPAAHESCPGAVAVLRPWQEEPSWYCLDPGRYGHVSALQRPIPAAGTGSAGSIPGAASAGGGAATHGSHGRSPAAGPDRKLVIEGNRAWASAASVRHRWLAEFLSRKAPPAGTAALVAQFVTAQMLTMPQPLRQALAHIHGREMYRVLGGLAAEAAGTAAQPRLWLLALAPIAACYEDQMTGSGEQRSTWRTDRYCPCPRADAGAWLRFLTQAGHQLSPIEQAVADGVPYRGDAPGDSLDQAGPSGPGTGAGQAGTSPGSQSGPAHDGRGPAPASGGRADSDAPGSPADPAGPSCGEPPLAA